MFLDNPEFSQVSHKSSKDSPIPQSDFAHRQVNGKRRPIFFTGHDFAPQSNDLGSSRLEIVLQVGVVFLFVRRGHQSADILTDQFGRFVAEQRFGCRVDRLDQTFFADGNDCIHCAIVDCFQSFLAQR